MLSPRFLTYTAWIGNGFQSRHALASRTGRARPAAAPGL